MKLTHATDDGLARLFVRVDTECRILIGQLDKPGSELVLVDPGLWFDRYRDHGLREVHRLENDRVVRMADRLARLDVLETDDRRDITREHLVPLLPLVRMHLKQPPDPLLPVLRCVENVAARWQRAGVDPYIRQLPDERIRHDLERQGTEGFIIGRLSGNGCFVVLGQVAVDRRNVQG